MFKVDESLIALDVEAEDAEALIRLLCKKLEEAGCVDSEHVQAVLEREKRFPTGLPTRPFCVAIPHGEGEGVNESALAFARLKKSVIFKNMADDKEELEVRMIFLIANNEPENQVKTLRRLSEMFSEPEQLLALSKINEPKEVMKMLKDMLQN